MLIKKSGKLNIRECEEKSSLKGKITSIIATSQSSINIMMCSIFSLLLRSNPERLEHITVIINGPDTRTGDPSLQNKKQNFFEDLRGLTWFGRSMPLTVIRVWSRIGHAQAIEMGIPWVHTSFYHLMHDDVIVLKDWTDLSRFDNNTNLSILGLPPLFNVGIDSVKHKEKNKLGFANLNSSFLLCNKNILTEVGSRWWGYHIEDKFNLSAIDEFKKYHEEKNRIVEENGLQIKRSTLEQTMANNFDYFNVDIGGSVFYSLSDSGYDIGLLSENIALHIGGQSWNKNDRFLKCRNFIEHLEDQIKELPDYWNLYKKYYEYKD